MRVRIVLRAVLAVGMLIGLTATAQASAMSRSALRSLLLSQHHAAQLTATLGRMSPAQRRYVIRAGLMPYRTVFSQTTRKSLAHAASCRKFSNRTVGTAKIYSWLGIHLYSYHSTWQWGGQCWVHSAHHQEWGDDLFVGWGYDGSSYGQPYGRLNSPMIGRQTFGHFSFLKFGVHDVVDAIMKVYGGWGQFAYGDWWWWRVTGP